ncbi:hypothetical protein COSO111634_37910 [Corallococcus soli]
MGRARALRGREEVPPHPALAARPSGRLDAGLPADRLGLPGDDPLRIPELPLERGRPALPATAAAARAHVPHALPGRHAAALPGREPGGPPVAARGDLPARRAGHHLQRSEGGGGHGVGAGPREAPADRPAHQERGAAAVLQGGAAPAPDAPAQARRGPHAERRREPGRHQGQRGLHAAPGRVRHARHQAAVPLRVHGGHEGRGARLAAPAPRGHRAGRSPRRGGAGPQARGRGPVAPPHARQPQHPRPCPRHQPRAASGRPG